MVVEEEYENMEEALGVLEEDLLGEGEPGENGNALSRTVAYSCSMSRTKILWIALPILLVAGCKEKNISPKEVLHRPISHAQQLEFVEFTGEANRTKPDPIHATISGSLSHGGQDATIHIEMAFDGTPETKIEAAMDIIFRAPNEKLLRLRSFQGTQYTASGARVPSDTEQQWYIVPPKNERKGILSFATLPDEILRITDIYPDEIIRERNVHHYGLALQDTVLQKIIPKNSEKMAQMNYEGEVWIDSRDFRIHRIQWLIETENIGTGEVSIDFEKHNNLPSKEVTPKGNPRMPNTIQSALTTIMQRLYVHKE